MKEVAPGHYARKQIYSSSRLVRWSHRGRFRTARGLVAPFAGRRLLDYGCGDGTFLALVSDLFPDAVGVDAAPDQIADCIRRFGAASRVSFATTDRLSDPSEANRYDIVVCMEVLEHCPDDIQETVLDRISDVTASGGTVVFSVPIEIGPTLVAKQGARALLALGGLTDYASRERYRPHELMRMLFAGERTTIPREEFSSGGEGSMRFTGHKGFSWRRLRRAILRRFDVARTLFSPLPALGALLNSQVWFVCRKR